MATTLWLPLLATLLFASASASAQHSLCERQIRNLQECQKRLLNDHGERQCGLQREQKRLQSATLNCMRAVCRTACPLRNCNLSDCRTAVRGAAHENVCRRITEAERELAWLVRQLRATQCKASLGQLASPAVQPNVPTVPPPTLAQLLVRTRRSANSLPQCSDSSCGGALIGYGRLQKTINNMPQLNAAIKATVKQVTYGNISTVVIDETVQLYPNETRLHVGRRIRWPFNCSCPQLKINSTYLMIGFFNSRYHFELSSNGTLGRIVFDLDRNNFRAQPTDELKTRVSKMIAKRSNSHSGKSAPSRGKRKAPKSKRTRTS